MNCIDCNLNFDSKDELIKHFYSEEHQAARQESDSEDEEEKGSDILLREQIDLVDQLERHYREFDTGSSIEGYGKVRQMLKNLKKHERLRHALIIRYMDDNNIKRGENKRCRCHKLFESTEGLIDHQMNCEYIQNCECNLCGNKFANQYILKTHMKKCISLIDKEFKCDYCPKSYTKLSSLTRHLKEECKKKPNNIEIKPTITKKQFCCEFCDKSYSTLGSLQRHNKECINKPTKVIVKKKFACVNCPKSYSAKSSYDRHLKECKPRKTTII